jgi:cytochrome c oxidase subunit 2
MLLAAAPLLVAPAVVAACGGSGGSGGAESSSLSGQAAEGLEIAKSNGCMTCHSVDGRRSVGPTWQGLYGSEVELEDGSTVVADDEYLTRAIEDPGAQVVAGFNGVMPDRDLSEADVAAIVAYLRTLGD